MAAPPGNRPAVPRDWFRGVPKRYVAGADTRGRLEGLSYPWSQQVIHEISGQDQAKSWFLAKATTVPIGMERLNNVPDDWVVEEYFSVILGRYSKSGIHFKGTGRPYGTNKMNPN